MSKLVSLDQITQLRELERARVRAQGVGYADEFQAFLGRLKSGGVSPGTTQPGGKRRKRGPKLPDRDPRILQQAKVLWDKGWGTRLGKLHFEQYLLDVPDVPTFPASYDERFPHLVLVDQRIQIVEACSLLNVSFSGTNSTFVPYDEAHSVKAPIYWMRCQDGKLHRNRKPDDCRKEFTTKGDELGLEVHEGLSLYAQHPDLLEVNAAWDLPGSVHADQRGNYAYLSRWTDVGVKLSWYWGGSASPSYGSASRGIV